MRGGRGSSSGERGSHDGGEVIHHHERLVCSCGAVIAQCRCMEPKTDKVVQDGCEACKAKKK